MEYDQEKCLDDAMKIVKAQSFHLSKAMDNNNLRQALKEIAVMLAELKSNTLNPRNYYALFSSILDELHFLESFFKEEYRRGRKIKHLYDSVQQAQNIIPRLYLIITAGRVYVDSGEIKVKDIIFELLNSVKGVQNPTRGLFLRYYLLKMLKDKLPDNEADLDISLKFIMQNLEDMNRLWIRLSTGCSGNEKLVREKERNELKVLVGENIIRLSNLDSLTLEKYKEDVLPKLINILLDSKDTLSQQYIVECIIHAFSENFNISCMSLILDTITKLVPSVDIKGLFINLMEKLARFISHDQSNEGAEDEEYIANKKKAQEEAEQIFGLLRLNIDKLVEENLKATPSDELKIIELLVAFLKFTLKSCPPHQRLETVNHIMSSGLTTLKNASRLSLDCIKQTSKLLTLPLENGVSIFSIPLFSNIMEFLDYSSKSTLALNILDSLSNKGVEGRVKETIDSVDKVNALLAYLRPLTEDKEDNDVDAMQFKYEQLAVSKLVFYLKERNPLTYYQMLKIIQGIYTKGGKKRIIYTLPSLLNIYINLVNNIFANYTHKQNPDINSQKPPYHLQYLEQFDYHFTDSSSLKSFLEEIYENIISLVTDYLIPVNYSQSFDLLMTVFSSMNIASELDFRDQANKLANLAFTMISEGKNSESAEKKLSLLSLFIGYLLASKCLSQDDYNSLVTCIVNLGSTFVKRAEQCQVMLVSSNLYYHNYYEKNEEKGKDILGKAIEYADYAMSTNNQSGLNLYIQIINKLMFYVEKGATMVTTGKKLGKLMGKVNNCIHSIKSEHSSHEYLKEVERYFEVTLKVIKIRKDTSENKIYKDISLEF
jgi:vacuolar protein sorting-associated protein 35